MAIPRLTGAHACAAAQVAAEVVGLGQRALGTGRGDLERVLGEQVAKLPRHALAELERDAVGVVDEQPQALGADALASEQLDLRERSREPGLYFGLELVCELLIWSKKRWAAKPTSRRDPRAAVRLKVLAVEYRRDAHARTEDQ